MRTARRSRVSPSGPPGSDDDDPLAGLPGLVDAVRGAVALESLVDALRHPQQGQLTQRREVADPEVVRQRGVDPLGGIDVAVDHPSAERLGRDVHDLDLVGTPDDLVRDRLLLLDPADLLHHVVEGLEVLDVDRRDDVDAGVEEGIDVLPALLVPAAGDVAVGELVDQRHRRAPRQDAVEVHLLERRPAVAQPHARHHLEPLEALRGVRAPMGLDVPRRRRRCPRLNRRRPSSSMA